MFNFKIRSNTCNSNNCWLVGVLNEPLRLCSALAVAVLASFNGIFVYKLVTSNVTKKTVIGISPRSLIILKQ